MPRVSEAEKQKSRGRILDAAADLLREKGIETTSLSDIMKAAGMTHGGFYRHFEDKDDLVAQAFHHAVDQVVHAMETAEGGDAKAAAHKEYIDTYLSADHVANRRRGCPMAALASEIGRSETQASASEAVDRVAGLLRNGSAQSHGYAQLALLVGAISIARLARNEETQATILAEAASAIGQISQTG